MGGAPYKSAKEGVGALSSVSENKLTTFKFSTTFWCENIYLLGIPQRVTQLRNKESEEEVKDDWNLPCSYRCCFSEWKSLAGSNSNLQWCHFFEAWCLWITLAERTPSRKTEQNYCSQKIIWTSVSPWTIPHRTILQTWITALKNRPDVCSRRLL